MPQARDIIDHNVYSLPETAVKCLYKAVLMLICEKHNVLE